MKKLWIFIVAFSFTAVLFSTYLKDEYLMLSHNFFDVVSSGLSKTSYAFSGLLEGEKLREENENLKKQLSVNTNIEAENRLLKAENKNLYNLLKTNKESYKDNVINANITHINTLADFYLTINKGTKDGVNIGDVCIWGKALVGRVTKSFDDFSHVTPIIAPNFTVGVMNTKGDSGIVLGSLSLCRKNMCEISFFSDMTSVQDNEVIVTSGLSDIYPEGLTVGKIQKDGDEKRLLAEIDFFKIRTVSLISWR